MVEAAAPAATQRETGRRSPRRPGSPWRAAHRTARTRRPSGPPALNRLSCDHEDGVEATWHCRGSLTKRLASHAAASTASRRRGLVKTPSPRPRHTWRCPGAVDTKAQTRTPHQTAKHSRHIQGTSFFPWEAASRPQTCVEIRFWAHHAIDATVSPRSRRHDGVEVREGPRNISAQAETSFPAKAAWRGIFFWKATDAMAPFCALNFSRS